MNNENEAMNVCQIFTEGEVLFGCVKPIKYKIVFMGTEAASCQKHYEFYRSEAERVGILDRIEFVEINKEI
jgi:hypothetical protein